LRPARDEQHREPRLNPEFAGSNPVPGIAPLWAFVSRNPARMQQRYSAEERHAHPGDIRFDCQDEE